MSLLAVVFDKIQMGEGASDLAALGFRISSLRIFSPKRATQYMKPLRDQIGAKRKEKDSYKSAKI